MQLNNNIQQFNLAVHSIDPQSLKLAESIDPKFRLLLFAVIALISFIGFFLALNIFIGRKSREKLVNKQLTEIKHLVNQSLKRIQLIEKHIPDYMSAMDPKIVSTFNTAKLAVESAMELTEEVDSLVAVGDYGAVIEAEEILDQPLKMPNASPLKALKQQSDLPNIRPENLGPILEKAFQMVGQELGAASIRSQFAGSLRPRKNTLENLQHAGIRQINRARRRLTKTFISPFISQD